MTTSWVLNYFSAEARWQFVGALDRAAEPVDLSWVYAESPALCPEMPGMPAARQGPKQPTAVVVVRWRDGRATPGTWPTPTPTDRGCTGADDQDSSAAFTSPATGAGEWVPGFTLT